MTFDGLRRKKLPYLVKDHAVGTDLPACSVGSAQRRSGELLNYGFLRTRNNHARAHADKEDGKNYSHIFFLQSLFYVKELTALRFRVSFFNISFNYFIRVIFFIRGYSSSLHLRHSNLLISFMDFSPRPRPRSCEGRDSSVKSQPNSLQEVSHDRTAL